MAEWQYMLSVENCDAISDECITSCDYYDEAQERTERKAFSTLFDETFQNIYNQAYATIMGKIKSKDKSRYKNKSKFRVKSKDILDTQLQQMLESEIDASSEIVRTKISEIFRKDLDSCICENFPHFKDEIQKKMRNHNKERREWDIDKLKTIKKKFERIGWD